MDIQVLPCGQRAVLIDLYDHDAVQTLRTAVLEHVEAARAQARAERARSGSGDGQETAAPIFPPDRTDSDYDTSAAAGSDMEARLAARPEWSTVMDVVPGAQTLLIVVVDDQALDSLRSAVLELAEDLSGSGGVEAKQVMEAEQVMTVPVSDISAGTGDGHGLEVLRTGPQALLQDLGRPGHAARGVARSGAADRGAYLLGGRLLGHDFDRVLHESVGIGAIDTGPAALELLLGGLEVRAHGDCTVAITGAPAPASIDGRDVDVSAPVRVHDGETLRLGTPQRGLRTYLSVRGGFDVEPVLNSRAHDTYAHLGPSVAQGSFLPIGDTGGEPLPAVDHVVVAPPPYDDIELEVLAGPRGDWLADRGALARTVWEVSEDSDRIGLRLVGEPLQRRPELEGVDLPAEGIVRGTVQVPDDGQPVLVLADHAVSGSEPAVGVLTSASADLAAQARPGQHLRLRLVERASKRR